MDCERAIYLISARIDQEIAADDRTALQAHLGDCSTCRAVAESFQMQDSELRQGFQPLRAQADAAGQQVVAELRATTAVTPAKLSADRFFIGSLLAAAALVALVVYWPQNPPNPPRGGPAPIVEAVSISSVPGYLAAKARKAIPAPQPLTVGATLQTQAGQRRRVSLPDGSILFVNQNTSLQVVSDRRLQLTAGEIYVEVEPQPDAPFIVETQQREVRALGTKFAVRAEEGGPRVVVTQGTVQISGLGSLLHAGQQLAPGSKDSSVAPRASYLLDWTRELVAAAESPLVPKSEHCGGSLVALDPNGQQAKLSLRKYRVDVHIEDGFARTTIDQTYFNHLAQRLEGTFYFPLPPDASLSRLAMYVVDGNQTTLNEGGMCERNRARAVFEQIVSRMQDPALLEWIDGSTFKMRVFPLEGRQEKRIILSYTQKLDSLYGQTSYRFPAGHNMDRVGDWSLYVRVKGAAKQAWKSATHQLKAHTDDGDLILEDQANDAKLDKDVQVSIADAGNPTGARFSSAEHEGAKYLMLRFRPDLSGTKPLAALQTKKKTDWLFLFESSGDRDPVLARTQIDVIRTFLTNVNHDDTFTILTASTRVGKLVEKLAVTPDNVKSALETLEKVHLVGALDLGQAIAAVEPFLKDAPNPYLVHVGAGIPVLGERGEDVLAKRLRADVPYVGVGVGKRWSRNFMKLAAERTSGAFAQINPDDEVSWRAFELFSTLRTSRLLGVKVVDNAEKVNFLTLTSAIAHGEEICAVARIEPGRAGDVSPPLPKSISVAGTLNGKPFAVELPVKDVAAKADYLPRTWAKLEIDRLLAENAENNRARIIELSKQMYVMTPFTSLLVLENEAMYQQYNVDRGRKDHWALYACPPKMPIVYEPLPNQVEVRNPPAGNNPVSQKPTAEQVLQTVMVRMPPRFFHDRSGQHYGNAMTVWQLLNIAYAVPEPMFENDGGDLELRLEGALDATQRGSSRLAKFDDRWGQLPRDLPVLNPERKPSAEGHSARPRPVVTAQSSLDFKRLVDFGYLQRGQSVTGLVTERMEDKYEFLPLYRRELGAMKDDSIRLNMERGPGFFGQEFGNLRDLEELDFADNGKLREAGEGKSRERHGRGRWNLRFGDGMPDMRFLDQYVAQMFNGQGRDNLLFYRPGFSGDERVFFDLVSYAPGMNTSRADIRAVLELEARPTEARKSGKVDAEARQLIERARSAGWEKLTFGADAGNFSITCDGAGRYRWERTLTCGLREQVICDGQLLWHLYPELAVGAKRSVSRFHRAELTAVVPWLLPPVEDLAHGADVRAVSQRTIRVVPLGAESARDKDGKPQSYAVSQYAFAANDRLAEYSVHEMPADKLLFRESYDADGAIRRFDAENKEVAVVKVKRAAVEAPELAPKTTGLVVLPLPYRERNHVWRVKQINEYKAMSETTALALLAADFAGGNVYELLRVLGERYQGDMKSIGMYTLLASAGLNVDDQPEPNQTGQFNCQSVLTRHGKQPLAKYLAFISNPSRRQQATENKLDLPTDSLIGRLAGFRDLWGPWRNGLYPSGDAAAHARQFAQVLRFIKSNRGNPFGWAMLDSVLNRGYFNEGFKLGLLDVLKDFEKEPSLTYSVKYEIARLTLHTEPIKARQLFIELYRDTFKKGTLPLIDHSFRQALTAESLQDGHSNGWFELVRHTADQLLKDKHAGAVMALAWQVQQLGDVFLADELLQRVLSEVPAEQRLPATLAVIEHYWQAGQFARAEALLQPFLDDAKTGDSPALWRLAAVLAQRQQKLMRIVVCLDKALEIEYRQLPEVINLQTLRQDFSTLLNAYGAVAQMYKTLETTAPPEFTAKVIRLADRWRTLDPDGTQACQTAAVVLRAAGLKELAWDYLTTPIALRPNEGGTYHSLAQNLQSQNEIDLADKAYALAFDTEPTNAQLLWDRAQMLQNVGRYAESRQVYARLADGQWQPRFQWMQQQARWQMGQRAWR